MGGIVVRDVDLKFIEPEDVFQAIEKCDSKKLKISYCSLTLNGKCINSKNAIIKINKIHKNCGFVEGVILKDNEPFENIILKSSQILSLECVKGGQKPNKPSIFEIIKNCNGLIRVTQCTKLEKGICKDNKTFNFMVTQIDEKNKNIKGYRIKSNGQPEYMVLDSSAILKVECLSPREAFNMNFK
jgi:hypothetical protein